MHRYHMQVHHSHCIWKWKIEFHEMKILIYSHALHSTSMKKLALNNIRWGLIPNYIRKLLFNEFLCEFTFVYEIMRIFSSCYYTYRRYKCMFKCLFMAKVWTIFLNSCMFRIMFLLYMRLVITILCHIFRFYLPVY